MPEPVEIRVQTVLYETSPAAIDRYLRGLGHAIRCVAAERPGSGIEVAFGDCSNSAVLGDDQVAQIERRLLAQGARQFRYAFFGENLGHGGAHNRLWEARDHGVTALFTLNPDTCAGPSSLAALVSVLDDSSVGIAEARQLPLEHQKAYVPTTGDTSWASGGFSLIRASVFGELDGFDDATFFLYCDDVDLSWRARLAGHRVVHQPAAVIFHDKTLSLEGAYVPSEAEIYHAALASLLLAHKWSRPDLVEQHVHDYEHSPIEAHARVLSEYRALEASGRLPQPVDPNHVVGQFQTAAYADSRFSLRV